MSQATIDPATFRHVLGHYPTGVTVVTGVAEDGEVLAMVVGTFTSVSIDPPLVAFLPMKSSRTFERMQGCRTLCINVLTGEQEQMGRHIASRKQDKLEGLDWEWSPHGAPILAGSLAWLDVEVRETIEAGDHWIAMCSVLDLGVGDASPPLIFFQGGYGRFVVQSLVARIDAEIVGPVRQGAGARAELERVTEVLGGETSLLAAINPDEMVSVATALAPGVHGGEGLGERIPIIPPIGDTYVCGGEPDEVDKWLAKAPNLSEDDRQIFVDRLEFCREHGYLISHLPDGDHGAYQTMTAAARRFAEGGLTPAQEREIREAISRGAVGYDLRPIEDDQTYDVGSIVVPVPNPQGRSQFTLRAAQLPRQVSGAEVRRWISELLQAAQTISAVVSPAQPA